MRWDANRPATGKSVVSCGNEQDGCSRSDEGLQSDHFKSILKLGMRASPTSLSPPAHGARPHSRWFSDQQDYRSVIENHHLPLAIYADANSGDQVAFSIGVGSEHMPAVMQDPARQAGGLLALLPPIEPERLGGGWFTLAHGCRFPFVVGEMAHGIATTQMVIAAAHAGLFGFFGSAGLPANTISDAIETIRRDIPRNRPWGINLIHLPSHPERETELVELFRRKRVERISASAFLRVNRNIVYLSASGLALKSDGTVDRRTHIFAKVSRPEVARSFMTPPSVEILRELVASGMITELQARLQSQLPVAEDVTIEADSGGHTDSRPLRVIYPAIQELRHKVSEEYSYQRRIRLGTAGGLGTPASVAAAFQLGADYVLTGSVNQAARESGLSTQGKKLLANCGLADTALAPAADMFERGAKVQVLKKGTMFPQKARRLENIYRHHDGLHSLGGKDMAWLEEEIFEGSLDRAWRETLDYHMKSDPALSENREINPKRKMALLFRRYLFRSSKWARDGNGSRRGDFQIWCGPAMGAHNQWVRGTELEPLENRTVGQISLNLLEGACVIVRAGQLRAAGLIVPDDLFHYKPRLVPIESEFPVDSNQTASRLFGS